LRIIRLTRLSDRDLNVAAHEVGLGLGKSDFQAVEGSELDVTEALGLAVQLVLDDADAGGVAVAQKVFDVRLGDVVGEVAQVSSEGGTSGEG